MVAAIHELSAVAHKQLGDAWKSLIHDETEVLAALTEECLKMMAARMLAGFS